MHTTLWTALVACCASAAIANPTITLVPLPAGYDQTDARGLSRDGTTIVGTARNNTTLHTTGWRFSTATGLTPIPGATANARTRADATSANGSLVVGWSEISPNSNNWQALWWGPVLGSATFTSLDSSARGVSGNGSVVVGAASFSGPQVAYRWTSSTGITSLGTLSGGTSSAAYGISTDGSVIVGQSTSSNGFRAFRYTGLAGMVDLGTLPGHIGSAALGTNINGSAIVGNSLSTSGFEAVIWRTFTGMQSLGVPAGYIESSALGVDDAGNVAVGFVRQNNGGATQASMWTPATGMVDLNTYLPAIGMNLTGWTLTRASGVSADGTTISGEGLYNGEFRAWIISGLTIPAPGATIALGMGALVCTRRRR
jgi:probable HAF family extracellular repeat protein